MTSTLFDNTRESQDRVINTFGKSLLSLCAALDLSILSGSEFGQNLCPVDLHIYMFMVTVWLFILLLLKKIRHLCDQLNVEENVTSTHMPLVGHLACQSVKSSSNISA